MGAMLKPKPSDLTDADWKHGSTDGEIFTVIRDGVQEHRHARATAVEADRPTRYGIVVNYVRILGPKTTKRTKSH